MSTTATIPTPGSTAALRGALPVVERVVDHEVQTVKVDWASPELGADIIKAALRDDLLRRRLVMLLTAADRDQQLHGMLYAATAKHLGQALSKAGATDWTLNPSDADRLAEHLSEAAYELDECTRPGCVWLAEDAGLCTAHAEATR